MGNATGGVLQEGPGSLCQGGVRFVCGLWAVRSTWGGSHTHFGKISPQCLEAKEERGKARQGDQFRGGCEV